MTFPSLSRRSWTWAALLLLLIFSGMRFVNLTERVMHNDEGVNGFFTVKLLTTNSYRYDPNNYHGPTLYYFQWLPAKILGLNVFTVRFTTVLASLLFLSGFIFCCRFLGMGGALTALLFAGLSTNVLFISRYFIHEIYVLLFTFGIFLSSVRYAETRRPAFLYGVALSAVLLFCTKETGVLHMVVMAGALVMAHWAAPGHSLAPLKSAWPDFRRHALFILLMVIAVWAVFFSSFFKNIGGLKDSFVAYLPWLKQGMESGHEKSWHYYFLKLIFPYESGLTVWALTGALAAFIRNDVKGWFLTFWAAGTAFVYSAIPYKTPWLVANFVLPMAMLAGYAVQSLVDWATAVENVGMRRKISILSGFFLVLAATVQIPQLIKVNYVETDDERHPQIYVHTSNQVFQLLKEIDDIAKRTGSNKDLLIQVVSPQYWPLPFYLKDYPSAKFWGTVKIGSPLDAPVIIAASSQRAEVRAALSETYSIKNYMLRPGYALDVWINNRAADLFRPIADVPDLLKPAHPSGPLIPGLREEIFNNGSWEGAPVLINRGRQQISFVHDTDETKPLKPPYSIRWTGFLRVPTPGIYRFSIDSDDGSKMSLDGIEFINNTGTHPLTRKSRSANLSAGYHALEIGYMDAGGTAEFSFYWTAPGGFEEKVPAVVLSSPRL